ncbi:MAG: glycoside hydrolase family 38 C-terminal domain-containing protein [Eubacteriales bacterium]|nr:glycoside hydrolase family 38 C-terminal domain-containing protein [Eubacteriales bacterium]
MKTIKGFLIMAGHLDIEWYQPLRSYRFWTVETLDRLRAAAKGDFPAYTLDGQVYPLEEYLEVAPETEEEMRRLIAEGRLAVGPFYTQFDEWLPSAENMIRNCLWGKRGAEHFGRRMMAGYLPDNFGHPVQLPQILNNFGLDSLLFMRGMPEIEGGHPDEFEYRGVDGSTILTSHFREGYGGAFDLKSDRAETHQPREVPYYPEYLSFEHHVELSLLDDPDRVAKSMIENVRRRAGRYPSKVVPLVAGGDHMPPQIGLNDALRIANELAEEIEFVSGTAEEYIEAMRAGLAAENAGMTAYDMELIGSRWQHILLGALSTRSYLKRMNFGCEALLERYAEPLQALAVKNGFKARPAYLAEAWRNLLINSAHDSIHGSSTDEVHTEMEARFMAARQNASGVIHESLAYLAAQEKGEGRPVAVWAGAKADAAQPVEVWLNIADEPTVIRDAQGNVLPTQVLEREPVERNGRGQVRNDMYHGPQMRKVLFMAQPEMGKVEQYRAVSGAVPQEKVCASDNMLENEFLRVDVRGALLDITDKRTGKTYFGQNLIVEDLDAGDDWDYSPSWIPGEVVLSSQCAFTSRLVEQGSVRAVIEMQGVLSVPEKLIADERSKVHVDMPVKFHVALYRGLPRVDVKMTVVNTAKDHRIRLHAPGNLITKSVLSQGQLAVLERPVERAKQIETWFQPPTQLLPMREWAALADGENGLAVALKGVYDYEACVEPLSNETSLAFTLLRGFELMGRINMPQRKRGASMAVPVPGAQCLGEHTIEWSFIPFSPSEGSRLPFVPLADAFLYPPVSHAVRTIDRQPQQAQKAPLYAWQPENIRFSAFKRAENDEGYVLRLYEDRGEDTQFALALNGFTAAYCANMAEEKGEALPIENGTVQLHAGPYKAITLILE